MNLKTKLNYQRIRLLTNIKNFEDIEIFINRSVGYFNKIKNEKERINKGHIENYFFILEDIICHQKNNIPYIDYETNNKIILEYGERILIMKYKDNYSFTMIVKEMRIKYKKAISRTLIYNFCKLNQIDWENYFE